MCSNRVCVSCGARVCARARDVGCVKRASALRPSRFFPPSGTIPLFFFLPLRVCLRAQHHLSFLSLSLPGSHPTLASPYPPGPLGLRSFSLFPPSCLSFSTFFPPSVLPPPPPLPDNVKKKERLKIYPCTPHGSPRGLAFKSRVPQ